MPSIASRTRAPMSGSSVPIGSGAWSTTTTGTPRRTSASAISMPMYPPPTTTAWRTPASRSASTLAPASRCETPWMPAASMPGRSGRTARAPVATTRWSNPTVDSAPVSRSRTTTAPASGVDRLDLRPQPDVDAPRAVLLGRPGDQVLAVVDVAGDPVRDPAGRVGRVLAPLERDHLQGAAQPLRLRGRAHSRRVPADHHHAFGHAEHLIPGGTDRRRARAPTRASRSRRPRRR